MQRENLTTRCSSMHNLLDTMDGYLELGTYQLFRIQADRSLHLQWWIINQSWMHIIDYENGKGGWDVRSICLLVVVGNGRYGHWMLGAVNASRRRRRSPDKRDPPPAATAARVIFFFATSVWAVTASRGSNLKCGPYMMGRNGHVGRKEITASMRPATCGGLWLF